METDLAFLALVGDDESLGAGVVADVSCVRA